MTVRASRLSPIATLRFAGAVRGDAHAADGSDVALWAPEMNPASGRWLIVEREPSAVADESGRGLPDAGDGPRLPAAGLRIVSRIETGGGSGRGLSPPPVAAKSARPVPGGSGLPRPSVATGSRMGGMCRLNGQCRSPTHGLLPG